MKLNHRLFLSFILALLLLWIALPRLPLYGTPIQFGFSILWLMFCFLVIGSNLYALLRLGRGEAVTRPAFSKEQKKAIRQMERQKRRQPSR